jgi:hypothetical protein
MMDSLLEFPSRRALSVCIWYVFIEMALTQYLYTVVSKLMSFMERLEPELQCQDWECRISELPL